MKTRWIATFRNGRGGWAEFASFEPSQVLELIAAYTNSEDKMFLSELRKVEVNG